MNDDVLCPCGRLFEVSDIWEKYRGEDRVSCPHCDQVGTIDYDEIYDPILQEEWARWTLKEAHP
jgi:hypothetical protein